MEARWGKGNFRSTLISWAPFSLFRILLPLASQISDIADTQPSQKQSNVEVKSISHGVEVSEVSEV